MKLEPGEIIYENHWRRPCDGH